MKLCNSVFLFFMLVGIFCICPASFGELSISDSNIIAGHYVYDLNFPETTNGVIFNNDVNNHYNVEVIPDPFGTAHYLRALPGSSDAGFTYKFDFSGTQYTPVSVTVRDKVSLFNNLGQESCEMVTEWSVNDVNYQTINLVSSPAMGGTNSSAMTVDINLPAGDKVLYYRMRAYPLPGDADGRLTDHYNQWNRIYDTSTDYFSVDFTVVKYSGGEGTEQSPYLISTPDDLAAIGHNQGDWGKDFLVVNDINMAQVAPSELIAIGMYSGGTRFTGVFDGGMHTISNLTMYSNVASANLGLFAATDSATIKNVILENPSVTATSGMRIGCLAGYNGSGLISNCHIINGYAQGKYYIGGLVGMAYGSISRCSCIAEVRATDATTSLAGGIGGWVHTNIVNCYAGGLVSATKYAGGLIGWYDAGTITNNYSFAEVINATNKGGLVGVASGGGMLDSFWDVEVSGCDTSPAGVGLTTREMTKESTFTDAGWDFIDIWDIGENQTYPYLRYYNTGDLDHSKEVDFTDFAYFAEDWLTVSD